MRIAIFSDIHGNCVALDAVLAELRDEPVDQLVCLGDAVQGGPQPAEVVARLRQAACPVVMGNADAWLLSGQDSGAEQIDATRRRKMDYVRAWSLAQLSDDDRAFVARFAPTVKVALGERRHADRLSMARPIRMCDYVILPSTPAGELQRMLGGFAPNILAGGHTHIQQIHHVGTSFYVGCGSVGLAYRHDQSEAHVELDPWAEYAVLTTNGDRIGWSFDAPHLI